MKKLITLLTLLFILASCGQKPASNTDTNNDNTPVTGGDVVTTPEGENTPSTTGTGEEIIVNIDANTNDNTSTGETITVTGSLDEQEVLNDIDVLLNDIINSAENE